MCTSRDMSTSGLAAAILVQTSLHPFYQDTTRITGEKLDDVPFSLVNRVTTSSWGNSSCTNDSNTIPTAKPMCLGSSNPTVISTILSDLTGSDKSKMTAANAEVLIYCTGKTRQAVYRDLYFTLKEVSGSRR